LRTCSECALFPCDRLVAWSGESQKYGEALNRLREQHMNDEEGGW